MPSTNPRLPAQPVLPGLAGEAAAVRPVRPRAILPGSNAPLTPVTNGGRNEQILPDAGGSYVDDMHARGPNQPTGDPRNAGFTINTGGGGGGGGSSMAVTPVERREVQAGELVENRLAGLLRSDSALSRMADIRGRREASRMGSSAGSYYGGAAQIAAQDIALPVAQQDASWVGRTASDNMNAQNERGNNELQAASAANVANIGAGASMFSAQLDADIARERMGVDERLTLGERDWRSGESRQDREWQSTEADRGREWQSREEALNREDRNADREDRQAWDFADRELERAFNTGQLDRQLDQRDRETLMGAIATAYSNGSLTAAQAQAAVRNIIATYRETHTIVASMPPP